MSIAYSNSQSDKLLSALSMETLAQASALSPLDGERVIVKGLGNATYIVGTATALAGDITFANAKVGTLQIEGEAPLAWFGGLMDAETLLDSATDDLVACNLAALRMQQEDGGTILLTGLAALSGTLTIPQRVIFKGVSRFFANQFTDGEVRPAGCGFYTLPGLNADVIDLKLDIYNDGGTLRETINNKVLNDYRYFGGLKDLIIYGNRSDTANPPSVTDKNTIGSGIKASGVRYPLIDNVVSMMCAEDGIETVSFDYGLGANACNNHRINSLSVINNAANGASLSGGDGRCVDINAGYNGVNGVSSTMGASRLSGESWNNQQDGVSISSGDRTTYDFTSYDNKRQGFRIAGTDGVVVRGVANANGRDTGLGSNLRVGVFVVDSNTLLKLDIISNGDKDATEYQHYGFNIANATNPLVIAGCVSGNNITSDWLISDITNVTLHSAIPSGANHVGFTALGDIDMSTNAVENAGLISFDAWTSRTPAAGTLNAGGNSLININGGNGETITDITGGGNGLLSVIIRVTVASVTFNYDNAKLRLVGGINKAVTLNQSISFVHVSGDIWQEV